MEPYGHEHPKALPGLPCAQPPFDYPPPPGAPPFDRPPPPNPRLKVPLPPHHPPPPPSPRKQKEMGGSNQQPPHTPPARPPPPQPLFEATSAFNAPQWGIVDLSSHHQHLFGGLKLNVAPAGSTAAPPRLNPLPSGVTLGPGGLIPAAGGLILAPGALLPAPVSVALAPGAAAPSGSASDGPFTCSLCWKVFKKPSHLHQHQIIHTGEKPFTCSVCSKSFNRRESLTRHVKTHSGLLRVPCAVCGKEFRDPSLTRHKQIHRLPLPTGNTDGLSYGCAECGERFPDLLRAVGPGPAQRSDGQRRRH
uniref:C2H2-type domain-containing protein n=1 Tax=Strigops habroptila TaxID=2489341 RepID=A0A672TZ94_STRHB